MTQEFPLNSTRRFKIFMADSANPLVGKTGLIGSFTVYLAKDGAAESTVSPTIQERGRGWYEVTPIAAHRDTLGQSAWTFQATGAVDYPVKEVVVTVDAQSARYGAAAAGDQMALTSGTRVQLHATQPDYAPAKTGDAMALTPGERTSLAGTIETELLNDASGGAFLAGIASQLQALFDNAGDIPVATLVNLISAGVWTNATRTLTALSPVTVGGYSAGQSPVDLLSSTVSKVSAIDAVLTALTEVVATVTRFKAAALSQAPSGGGGGSGDASQTTLLEVQDTVEAIATTLAGTRVEVNNPVKEAGAIELKLGDDYLVAATTQLRIPVTDVGGVLHAKLLAATSIAWGAARGRGAAQVTGTVATPAGLSYASNVLTISVEIPRANLAAAEPGFEFDWDIQYTTAGGHRVTPVVGTVTFNYDRV